MQKQLKKQLKKGEDLGLTVTREENLTEWYNQVIVKNELIEYTDISGCYVLRPDSYAIWEAIQSYFDDLIKNDGVRNAYFPCFVTKKALETESENFEGFCPEVAWITKHGNTSLTEPIALRPTSEAIIYPIICKWIRTYEDLPIRLNQWCNVVRWEMNHCMPFLRSREFLWQEGHSVFATKQEADSEVFRVLEFYRSVYEDLLAIPVIKGKKTDKEKFAGGDFTTTIEVVIPQNGRSIQAATSHSLGQKFAQAYDITFMDRVGQKKLVWQNSWGLSTRSIGAMIMIHGDNKGLKLPPKIAQIQVIIIPIFKKGNVPDVIENIYSSLVKYKLRVKVDRSDNSIGRKYNHWELKGIPVRIEIGEKDLQASSVTVYRRDIQTKIQILIDNLHNEIPVLLEDIHKSMFATVHKMQHNNMKKVLTFSDLVLCVQEKCVALVPFCLSIECEEKIKENCKEKIKSLCRPLDNPVLDIGTKCIGECGIDAKEWCLFGKSY